MVFAWNLGMDNEQDAVLGLDRSYRSFHGTAEFGFDFDRGILLQVIYSEMGLNIKLLALVV